MADVIVRGVEMPEECWDCWFSQYAWYRGKEFWMCLISEDEEGNYRKTDIKKRTRPDWCPLEPAPEWISVDYDNLESLPIIDKPVLYCVFGRSVGEGYYRGFDGQHHVWKIYAIGGTHWDNEVTHWMPLPKPPKEG